MGMNPDTNQFEILTPEQKGELDGLKDKLEGLSSGTLEDQLTRLVRPDGSAVPSHWPIFQEGETVVIKSYTFRVAHIGEKHILFEPVGPLAIDVPSNT